MKANNSIKLEKISKKIKFQINILQGKLKTENKLKTRSSISREANQCSFKILQPVGMTCILSIDNNMEKHIQTSHCLEVSRTIIEAN